jgi:3-oxoadipate enol-lactonase
VDDPQRVRIDGVELEYELMGAGEPVVLIHNGVGPDWYDPLTREPALTEGRCVLTYHRAGFGGSGPRPGPLSFAEDARHCRALMGALGIERGHLVGHSSSAMTALALALDDPGAVHSLALLESARPAPQTALQATFVEEVARPALERYAAGDVGEALDIWLTGVCGPGYLPVLEAAVPDALESARGCADSFFGEELPAVMRWSFGPDDARRITQPALAVLGTRSQPTFRERRDLLLSWLPAAEPFDLDATHLLCVENPRDMAAGLAAFFDRNPLSRPYVPVNVRPGR